MKQILKLFSKGLQAAPVLEFAKLCKLSGAYWAHLNIIFDHCFTRDAITQI